MKSKFLSFSTTLLIGMALGALFSDNAINCGSNRRFAAFNESEVKSLRGKRVITFSPQIACFRGNLNEDCITIESDTVGEIIDYAPVYLTEEVAERETIQGYKLTVKWANQRNEYISYVFKESYFTKDEKEINLYKILD